MTRKIDDGVDAGGSVIACDHVLRQHVHGHGPQIELDHLVDHREE
jgi:hypothetical protein